MSPKTSYVETEALLRVAVLEDGISKVVIIVKWGQKRGAQIW